MTQPTPTTCKCQKKKADYLFREIYNEWVELHTPIEFDEMTNSFCQWLMDKFRGKIISIYFDNG